MALGAYGLTANGSSADLTITNAGTFLCTPVVNLVGMSAVSLQLGFAYGAGGASVRAFVQTSLDQGNTWFDIACALFQQASKNLLLNLSGLTPITSEQFPVDGSLGDDTVLDGILGDRLRLKAVVVGTYSGSTLLKGRMVAR